MLVAAAVPAIVAAVFAVASAAIGSLSPARRAALRQMLSGAQGRALERYDSTQRQVEARWLAWRVLGITTSALIAVEWLPLSLGPWRPVIAALGALVAFGVPTEIGRVLAAGSAERLAPILLLILRPFELLVAPLAAPIGWIAGWFGRSLTTPGAPTNGAVETEVELIINEGELNGSLASDQSEMIRNVLEFGDVTAGDLMVPRTHVTALDIDTPFEEVLRMMAEHQHSRYPVYKERIDNVVGVLHVKDVLAVTARHPPSEVSLTDLIRQPVAFVPETQPASSVLKDMRAGRHHLAVVIDEFGGFNGIVTLEDLVEEIVGDIRDEHDTEEPPIVDLGSGRLLTEASVAIDDLSRYLGTELEEEDADYNSVGGFVVSRLGRVPPVGTSFTHKGLRFIVREADERHVVRVEIVRPNAGPQSVAPTSSKMSAA
jgi:CBS domain containing-hemolysin-like protein